MLQSTWSVSDSKPNSKNNVLNKLAKFINNSQPVHVLPLYLWMQLD